MYIHKGDLQMKRRTAREKALQALFQMDISKIDAKEALENVLNGKEGNEFLEDLVEGTSQHIEVIDDIISQHLERWTIDRLAKVDLNILRIGTYELIYKDDVPDNVVINEAIEIGKKYGDEKSGKFVNGVLNKIKENKSKYVSN